MTALAALAAIPAMNTAPLPPTAQVQFARVSAPGASDAMSLLKGGVLEARADAQFVKLSLVFVKPVEIGRVEADSCGEDFQDGADFFLSPGLRQFFAEGGTKVLKANVEKEGGAVQTLAINFRHTQPVCLKALRLFDLQGRIVPIRLPDAVLGQVVSAPGTDDPNFLFDLRSDTVVGSEGGELNFSFEGAQKIDGVLLWSGDQRAPDLFASRGRAGKMILSGDGGFKEELALKDVAGAQEIRFAKPFHGEHLSMRFTSARSGVAGQKAYLTEMRFLSGSTPHVLSTRNRLKAADAELREAFERAGLGRIIDHEVKHGEDKDSWLIRLRSDGSFFVRGYSDDDRLARAFSALGTYEIVNASEKSVQLRLHGRRRTTASAWDGDGCGIACDPAGKADDLVVQEVIEIEKWRANTFMVRNRTPKKSRSLGFNDLRVTLSSLHE